MKSNLSLRGAMVLVVLAAIRVSMDDNNVDALYCIRTYHSTIVF